MKTPAIMKWEGRACGVQWIFPGSQHNNDVYRTKLGHLFNGTQIVWRTPRLHQTGFPREILAVHKSALAYTVKGGNGGCLWSRIWVENILCDLFLSVHNVDRRKWKDRNGSADSVHSPPRAPIWWWMSLWEISCASVNFNWHLICVDGNGLQRRRWHIVKSEWLMWNVLKRVMIL